ncbi:hypothetical protein PIB30_037758 [Stylosanthes scabra]|uniref:Uncharacterized protein n=1 Tax=Stylosanthes scabra TaxID=79078 RepID=A0ABU6UD49_9FABA|nr:hypothetical protein [Stylosanthes scabra]
MIDIVGPSYESVRDLGRMSAWGRRDGCLFKYRRSEVSVTRRSFVVVLVSEKLLGGAVSALTADACVFSERGERKLLVSLFLAVMMAV